MQMSSYWGSGTAVGKIISRAGEGVGGGFPPPPSHGREIFENSGMKTAFLAHALDANTRGYII